MICIRGEPNKLKIISYHYQERPHELTFSHFVLHSAIWRCVSELNEAPKHFTFMLKESKRKIRKDLCSLHTVNMRILTVILECVIEAVLCKN